MDTEFGERKGGGLGEETQRVTSRSVGADTKPRPVKPTGKPIRY